MFNQVKLYSIIRCDGDKCELFFSGPTIAYELAILQRKYFYSKFKDIFNKYKFRRFTVLRESEKVLLCVYFHSYMPDYLGDTVDYGTISQAQYNIAKSESDKFLASGDDDMDDIGEAFKHMSIDRQWFETQLNKLEISLKWVALQKTFSFTICKISCNKQ